MIWFKPGYGAFMDGEANTILTAATEGLIATIFVNLPILLFTGYASTIVNTNASNHIFIGRLISIKIFSIYSGKYILIEFFVRGHYID